MAGVERARKLQDAITREAQRYSFEEAMHAMAAVVAAAVVTADVPQHARSRVLQTFVGNVLLALGRLDQCGDPLGPMN